MTKIILALIGIVSTASAVVPGKGYRVQAGTQVIVSHFCLVPDQAEVRLAAFLGGNMEACLYLKGHLAANGNVSVFKTLAGGNVTFTKTSYIRLERGQFESEVGRRNGGIYQQMESSSSQELMQSVRKLRTDRACRDFDEQE